MVLLLLHTQYCPITGLQCPATSLVSYTYVQIIACVALYNTKRRDFLSFFILPFLCCDLLRGGPSFNIKERKFESLSIPSIKKKFRLSHNLFGLAVGGGVTYNIPLLRPRPYLQRWKLLHGVRSLLHNHSIYIGLGLGLRVMFGLTDPSINYFHDSQPIITLLEMKWTWHLQEKINGRKK